MDNKLGIVGYGKLKEGEKTIGSIIFSSLVLLIICFLMVTTVSFSINANIFYYIVAYVISFISCYIFTLIKIKINENNKKDYLYIYFKDKNKKEKFFYSSYYLEESVNFILENKIEPIDNDDYYLVRFIIYEEVVPLYNKLKNKYEIISI